MANESDKLFSRLAPFVDMLNTSWTTNTSWALDMGQPNISMVGPPQNSSMGGENIALQYITLVLYLLTFVIGLFGNALVIYILLRFQDVRSKSVANIYILNLSIADLVFIFTLPLFCYATFTKNWIFGGIMCKITYVFREINKFGSIFTLGALSIDRFLASFHTLAYLRTNSVGKVVCMLVWVASLAMCTPFFMYSYTVTSVASGKSTCKIMWPASNRLAHIRVWSYSQLTVGLLVPLLVIIVSYLLLLKRMKTLTKNRQSQRSKKPSRKMTRTILVVVIIFISCQVGHSFMIATNGTILQ